MPASMTECVSDFLNCLSASINQLCSSSSGPSQDPNCLCPSLQTWSQSEHSNYLVMCSGKKCSWIIPLGGNAFISNAENDDISIQQSIVTPCGLGSRWTNSNSLISVFFHSTRPGDVLIALRLRVASGMSNLQVSVTKHDQKHEISNNELVVSLPNTVASSRIDIQGSDFQLVPFGRFLFPGDGYMRLDIQGISRTGPYFADVSHILIVPESNWFQEQTNVRFVADPQEFYWGRRGPSVHLRYDLPPATSPELEYFYTELTVPKDQDVIGAYFCAAGFHGGYFGIQVNSTKERRILFSIWSAFVTDNPADIPEEYRVVLLKKGPDVISGEFGDEGSGGQSYLIYPWESGKTYKFLIYSTPLDAENTIYTAWFTDPSVAPQEWKLIASFKRPKDSSWLRGLYAFSENFIPEMGHKERQCIYGNQWVRDKMGVWTECNKATFTADNTAAQENRMDICGGVDSTSGQFFLRNCGFFSDAVKPNTEFNKTPNGIPPNIDFPNLP